ncbi:MAG TPA: DNA-3-methyladenine glycosylase I [Methylophilaceae bacterium]
MKSRCFWASSEPNTSYHDTEWGVPLHDEHALFEFLILEGAQAGLSWVTILKKRQHYRDVFDQFDPQKVALYDETKVAQLLNDPGIIRNRLKIAAAINNARQFLAIQQQFGSFDQYLWHFVDGRPIINHWQDRSEIPTRTAISDALSKDLAKRGFKFVGTTICYAMMQAVGMVNDHTVDCFRHADCM